MQRLGRQRGCLLGLAWGDAVGTTVEFRRRGTVAPLREMVGGGSFDLPAGTWTDETSMAPCLATSPAELGCFDADDQMRRYCRWHRDGYLSSIGHCLDRRDRLQRAGAVRADGDAFSGSTDFHSAGNGCIMCRAPVRTFFFPAGPTAVHWAGEIRGLADRLAAAPAPTGPAASAEASRARQR